jgi:hypothetical protein
MGFGQLKKQGGALRYTHIEFKFFARIPNASVSEDAFIKQQQLNLPLTCSWSQLSAYNNSM